MSDKGTSETNVLVPNVGREIGILPWRAIGTVLGRQFGHGDRQDLDPAHGVRILRGFLCGLRGIVDRIGITCNRNEGTKEYVLLHNKGVCRLTTGIRPDKRVVRRLRRCVNFMDSTYSKLDSIAYYTRRLYSIAYCS